MRYAGWYARRRGLLEHLDNGVISLLDAAVHDFLCLTADHRTGVARASAEKIRALCPSDIGLRAIQRSLAHLESIGWIKRFRTHGQRGNYPVLLNKFYVVSVTDADTDASPTWFSVNAEHTTDWRDIQFDVVTDTSFNRELMCHSRVTDPDTHVSPVQEGISETEESKSNPVNPLRSEPVLCSRKADDGWQFSGLIRKRVPAKFRQGTFSELLNSEFERYQDSAHDEDGCACASVDFVSDLLDRCRNAGVEYPKALLKRQADLEAEEHAS